MPAHLFLVRHGESAFNAEGRVQGQADAPLSDRGRQQAAALPPLLERLPFDRVVTSDLARARDTGALAGHPDAPTDPRWRERAMGAWENELEADVGRGPLKAFRVGELTPPGGETIPEFVDRVGMAIDALAEQGGSWLVFTHGGCVRAAVAHLTGADFNAVAGPVNCSLSVLQLGPRRRLLAYNWTGEGGLPRATDPGSAEAPPPSG